MSLFTEFTGPLELAERSASCPYCGEMLQLLVDPENIGADYIEDCQVCCSPMVVRVWLDELGEPQLELCREDQ